MFTARSINLAKIVEFSGIAGRVAESRGWPGIAPAFSPALIDAWVLRIDITR